MPDQHNSSGRVILPDQLSSRFLFFTGKGGVGKTTLACATAVTLADRGLKVLLVSTDPASNIGETLETEISGEPAEIPGVPGLRALNIDPDQAAESYRQRVLAPYTGSVPDSELATMREELSGACTVEIAAFDTFAGLLAGDETAGTFDRIVFDTAPTGHTLRLLDLPRAWTSFLDANTRGASCLGPHGGLMTRQERFLEARRALENPALTAVVLVTRPDRQSAAEAARTSRELKNLGLANQFLAVNGLFRSGVAGDPVADAWEKRGNAALAALPEPLRLLPRADIPLFGAEMLGLGRLREIFTGVQAALPLLPSPPKPEIPGLRQFIDEIAVNPQGLVMIMGKGGVGKTTVAAAVAVELASRGIPVHLSTTDPAGHIIGTIADPPPLLEISRIDPEAETRAYVDRVMAAKGANLDADGRALLLEDLKSPCTEEVAVFHAFSRTVFKARSRLVILDTAPTGHTLLLLDATGAYHHDVLRGLDENQTRHVTTPLMKLQDPAYTRILLVTLAERTPVSEAGALQEDLERAGITPYGWVVNSSLAATGTRDPVLQARVQTELSQLERISRDFAKRVYLVPWTALDTGTAAEFRSLIY